VYFLKCRSGFDLLDSRRLARLQRIQNASSHQYPQGAHFSNFIGFLSSSTWLPLPTKS